MPFFKNTRRLDTASDQSSDKVLTEELLTKAQIKRATRVRNGFGWFSSTCLLVTIVFLILVEIGNTSNKPVLRSLWFISLNLSNVVPSSVPLSAFLNTVARTLGLHDFYQVGLWNFCEGYLDSGITHCSKSKTLYWFNPVKIISSELLAGAAIELPARINNILSTIEVASKWMFGLFLAGACLSFVLMFLLPCAVHSRWVSFALTGLTFLNALIITAAAVIATVMFTIMRDVFEQNTRLNIEATIGHTMFACMWVAAAFAILAWLFQFGMCCCCASRRDVRHGKKKGSRKAYLVPVSEK